MKKGTFKTRRDPARPTIPKSTNITFYSECCFPHPISFPWNTRLPKSATRGSVVSDFYRCEAWYEKSFALSLHGLAWGRALRQMRRTMSRPWDKPIRIHNSPSLQHMDMRLIVIKIVDCHVRDNLKYGICFSFDGWAFIYAAVCEFDMQTWQLMLCKCVPSLMPMCKNVRSLGMKAAWSRDISI